MRALQLVKARVALEGKSQEREVLDALMPHVSDIVDSYIEAMLWAETYDGDDPRHKDFDRDHDDRSFRDLGYDESDLTPATKEHCKKDVVDFIKEIAENDDAAKEYLENKDDHELQPNVFGNRFWLTRNGSGGGFREDGYRAISELAGWPSKRFGEEHIWANRHGQIEVQ